MFGWLRQRVMGRRKEKRSGVGRIVGMSPTIVGLALVCAMVGCAGTSVSEKSVEVDMNSNEVTERDLEVARQMDAPDQVIEALESGEWMFVSDRMAVRYAELAIDYMQQTYGQECHASWSTVPSVLVQDVEVRLVAVGGEHDGAEVRVTISPDEPHTYEDTWGAVLLSDEYERAVQAAFEEALADVPRRQWATNVWIDGVTTGSQSLSDATGGADLYLSRSVVSTDVELNALCDSIDACVAAHGLNLDYYVTVPAADPEDGQMTAEYGHAASVESGDAVLLRTSSFVKGGQS